MKYEVINGTKVYDIKDIEEGTVLRYKEQSLSEIESVGLEELYADYEYEEEVYQESAVRQVWVEKGYLHIPEIHAKVHSVYVCLRVNPDDEEDEAEYEIDFTGYTFFHDQTNEIIYEEGSSSISTALSNGFKKEIEDLNCAIYF